LAFKDFKTTQKALQAGDTSLQEVVESYIRTIDKTNPSINSFISIQAEQALLRAEEVQKKIESKTAGKLAGAVFGIKDLITEKGKIASCASNILKNYEAVYDATVIEKLKAEDAVFIGRLNMDEFAMGSSNENTIYGPVRNPHDISRVPGGSSGGSAAAIAAKQCNLTLGSDTGGSIRQPASFCGIVGIKPSYGRVSRYGLIAYASSFDCIGPLAQTVADAADVLEVISGADLRDGTSARVPVPSFAEVVDSPSSKMRIGVPEEYFGIGLDPEIKKHIDSLLQKN